MLGLFALAGQFLAAALFAGLALFQLRRWNGDPRNRPLAVAFAVVALWAMFLAVEQLAAPALLAESARNLAFLAFMYGIVREADGEANQRGVKAVYVVVATVVGLQIGVAGLFAEFHDNGGVLSALAPTAELLGLVIAAGALILVHNLYGQAAPASRPALRYPMAALAAMWAFDLHVYTIAYFTESLSADLLEMRGLMLALLAPVFAVGLRGGGSWKVQLSRAATFQTVSVVAVLSYILLVMLAGRAAEAVGGPWGRFAELGTVLLLIIAAAALLPSRRSRAWLGVFLAKHLFEHRYDYRLEWLRFTDTIGRETSDGATLEERVVKALADIAGAPGGVLLLVDDHYRLTPAARWNAVMDLPAPLGDAEELLRTVEARRFVLDFQRPGTAPAWLRELQQAWAGVPLIHAGKLVGLVILEHPPLRRPLDWEDFDLFRMAGIQAASYIAEARGQQALADSRRFDEFNRRFAFIMHDLKNLVSQLSLVARNAERHADNPEFRADMVVTLQSSVKKMNDLLARLSPGARRSDPPRPIQIEAVAAAVAAARRRAHPLIVEGDGRLTALADAAGLEQALAHLLQNAIDASAPDMPVEIHFRESGGDAVIEVIDRGRGMSGEFIRTRLFQPFVSTKEHGFGIGAYEARMLVTSMGGRLEVESAEGEGSRFTIFLPGADAQSIYLPERMRA